MKYLHNYTDEVTTRLLNETGAFFAFSPKQFKEQKKEGIKYASIGSGLFCPKENTEKLIDGLDNILEAGIKQDLEENGKKAIIHRELGNHEYCITHDITDTARALSGYGITEAEIRAETAEYLRDYYAWEEAQEAKAS